MALTTSNKTLHNSHETENVTKAVDHKPTDSKTCTEFRDNHYLTIGDILQIPLYRRMRRQIKSYMKTSDPLNLPMTPKFSNKGSSMIPINSGLAEKLMVPSEQMGTY